MEPITINGNTITINNEKIAKEVKKYFEEKKLIRECIKQGINPSEKGINGIRFVLPI